MKKKLTLILALCACLVLGAGFAACEKEDGKSSGSSSSTSSSNTLPNGGQNPNGGQTPTPTPTPITYTVTAEQWAAAFAFENVTIEYYMVVDGTPELYQTYYLDGDKGLLKEADEDALYEINTDWLVWLRSVSDFSDFYESAAYQQDSKLYYLESLDVLGDGSYVYENAYLTFNNGKVVSCKTTMIETEDGKTDTYNVEIKFSNYGTTVGTLEEEPVGPEDPDPNPDDGEEIVNINQVTAAQWEEAFAFENVTIQEYENDGGISLWTTTYYLDGEQCLIYFASLGMEMDGTSLGFAATARQMLDLSKCYDMATYQEDRYYIESYDISGTGDVVYGNIYIRFEKGKVQSCSFTENSTEEGVVKTRNVTFTFDSYGTTVATKEMPITQEEWEEVFDSSKFGNVTTEVSFAIEGIGGVTETICSANNMEKATVIADDPDIIVDGELYCVNYTWYKYNTWDGSVAEMNPIYDAELVEYTMVSDNLKGLIQQATTMYSMVQYDQKADVYFVDDGKMGMYFYIADGELKQLEVIDYNEDGTYSQFNYTFSNYGETEFDVPFKV